MVLLPSYNYVFQHRIICPFISLHLRFLFPNGLSIQFLVFVSGEIRFHLSLTSSPLCPLNQEETFQVTSITFNLTVFFLSSMTEHAVIFLVYPLSRLLLNPSPDPYLHLNSRFPIVILPNN